MIINSVIKHDHEVSEAVYKEQAQKTKVKALGSLNKN